MKSNKTNLSPPPTNTSNQPTTQDDDDDDARVQDQASDAVARSTRRQTLPQHQGAPRPARAGREEDALQPAPQCVQRQGLPAQEVHARRVQGPAGVVRERGHPQRHDPALLHGCGRPQEAAAPSGPLAQHREHPGASQQHTRAEEEEEEEEVPSDPRGHRQDARAAWQRPVQRGPAGPGVRRDHALRQHGEHRPQEAQGEAPQREAAARERQETPTAAAVRLRWPHTPWNQVFSLV